MSTNDQIFGLRKQIGARWQSAFEPVMLELEKVLQEIGRTHPYDADKETIRRLMSVATFANGCSGSAARVDAGGYLYHLTSAADFASTWTGLGPIQPATIGRFMRHCSEWQAADGGSLSTRLPLAVTVASGG